MLTYEERAKLRLLIDVASRERLNGIQRVLSLRGKVPPPPAVRHRRELKFPELEEFVQQYARA